MTITVKYSCNGCGLHRVECPVPARTVEDVVFWTEQILGRAVGEDHANRSPFCTSRTMSEVMVPISGAEKIGGSVVN